MTTRLSLHRGLVPADHDDAEDQREKRNRSADERVELVLIDWRLEIVHLPAETCDTDNSPHSDKERDDDNNKPELLFGIHDAGGGTLTFPAGTIRSPARANGPLDFRKCYQKSGRSASLLPVLDD